MKIKYYLFTCLLIQICQNSFGQSYEPIVDTSKMWVVFESPSINPIYPPEKGQTIALKIKDSTMLSDSIFWYNVYEATDSCYNLWDLKGYIHEKNKIVRYKDKIFPEIDTLYNFNLNIGDSVHCYGYLYFYISNISYEFFCNKERKTYNLGFYGGLLYKIYEGIGSNRGLLEQHYCGMTGVSRFLVCYYENGILVYRNPDFNSCYINTSAAINEIPDEGLFKIYPNPSDGYFIIESKNITPSEKVDIFIINSSGNLLLKSNIDNEYKIINLSSFAKGLYFYYIISKNKIYKSGTLIIK